MDPKEQEHPDSTPAHVPSWRAFIEDKWEALRRQALGLDPPPQRKLSQLAEECQVLAAVAAWYESYGNITQAARRMGTSRRALRERLLRWREENPQLPPPPPDPRPKTYVRRRKPSPDVQPAEREEGSR